MTRVQSKQCSHCASEFDIHQEDRDFYDKVSPKFGSYTAEMPAPRLCPSCRERRRLAFRNERKLYRRKCDASKKNIISIHSPDKPYQVYSQKIWRSDARDPMDYAHEYDPTVSFTEQFWDLMSRVPMAPLTSEFTQQENCDYTNSSWPWKNCYMSFEWAFCENVLHSKSIFYSQDCIDCSYSSHLTDCFQCVDSERCTSSSYVQYCTDSSFLQWCYNCHNCQFCINCDNLTNKKYCIENKQYDSKEAFEKAKAGYVYTPRGFKKLTHWRLVGNEDVTEAKNVSHAKNSSYVSTCSDIENVKFARDVFDVKDSYDFYSWWENVQLCYELQESGRNVMRSAFLYLCRNNISDSYYCYYCTNSSHLFACVWLRHKKYCIFNKQYTKEEYEKIVPQIIENMKQAGEWWEFFHPSLSPFGYNETTAQEDYPEDKDSVVALGYKWSEYEKPLPTVERMIEAKKLPRNIQAIPDTIINHVISCSETQKPFRVTSMELEFYRKHDLSFPMFHPDVRHAKRMQLRK